jgi:predicted nucleic acid-binding protein
VPKSCIIDSGALVALLDPREEHHQWAKEAFARQDLPWLTCESVISEAFFLLHAAHARALEQLLKGGHLRLKFTLREELDRVLDLRARYANVPMSLADACIVRMTEVLNHPVVLTTDTDFKIYRRHGRDVVPCLMPN